MDLVRLLADTQDAVLDEASDALGRSHLKHYGASGDLLARERMQRLYELVLRGVAHRDLLSIVRYVDTLASERYDAGFDIGEVQTAFNVLEEAIWRLVVRQISPEELPGSIALISTVFGVGKDALARSWVRLATKSHVPHFDVAALFAGTDS